MSDRRGDAAAEASWKERLTPEQYRIAREGGTEPPFSGPHLDERRTGSFSCVCCSASLFSTAAKYDSGTGWPSFHSPISASAVTEHDDRSLFLRPRTEVRCAACEAHLGHVFDDGPAPTGKRYCINGRVLRFAPSAGGEDERG